MASAPTSNAAAEGVEADPPRRATVLRVPEARAVAAAPAIGSGAAGVTCSIGRQGVSADNYLAQRAATTSPISSGKAKSADGIWTSAWAAARTSLDWAHCLPALVNGRSSEQPAHAEMRTAFPIRELRDGQSSAAGRAEQLAISPYQRIGVDAAGVEHFDLWIAEEVALGASTSQLPTAQVGVRLVAEAWIAGSPESSSAARGVEQVRVRMGFQSVSAEVRDASAKGDRHGGAREVGPYVRGLQLRATVVPPMGTVVVTEMATAGAAAGGPTETNITTEMANSGERNHGLSVSVGGEAAAPIPSVTATVDRKKVQGSTTTAELARVPGVQWSAVKPQRRGATGNTTTTSSVPSTYAEWTARLATWSNGLTYEPEFLFAARLEQWSTTSPRVTTPPPAADGWPSLAACWTIYPHGTEPSSPYAGCVPQASAAPSAERHSQNGEEPTRLARHPHLLILLRCFCGRNIPASVPPPPRGGGALGDPAVAQLDGGGARHPPRAAPADIRALRRCSPRRLLLLGRSAVPEFIVLAVEVAPQMVAHRQAFHTLRWWEGGVVSEAWPPPGADAEAGVHRFLIPVCVRRRREAHGTRPD